jgi:serine/threonine protein kinase
VTRIDTSIDKKPSKIRLFQSRIQQKVRESRNGSRASERRALQDGTDRDEQTATPSSFESSISSQKPYTSSDGTGRIPSITTEDTGTDMTHKPKSMSISGPVEKITEQKTIIDESDHPTWRKISLPTIAPSIQDNENYQGRSVLNDATILSPTWTKEQLKEMKGKSPVRNIDIPDRKSSKKPRKKVVKEVKEVESGRAPPVIGSSKEKARQGSADEEHTSDNTDNLENPSQGEGTDWDLSSPKKKPKSARKKNHHEPEFPDSPKDEKSKKVASWILKSTAPGPVAPVPPPAGPLPAIPGHVEESPQEDSDFKEPSPRHPSFHPIELDLHRDDDSFAAFAAAYTAASIPNSVQNTSSGKHTSGSGKHTSGSGNHTINTSSSQALPIQTNTTRLNVNGTRPISRLLFETDPPNLKIPHEKYAETEIPPYTSIRPLGVGSLGMVDEVSLALHHPSHPSNIDATTVSPSRATFASPISPPTLARKSVQLISSSRPIYFDIIRQEVKALRNLSHPHIVRLIGTYEYKDFYVMLMTPVGDRSLRDLLQKFPAPADPLYPLRARWVKKWFACLASSLSYIHSVGIRHEDIKPSNIIHRGPDIYLTDFSSCTEFVSGMTTSTDTPAGRITRVYSAPEALTDVRHGVGADVFSLGCVFAEMATVAILGRRVPDFWKHVGIERVGVGDGDAKFYCRGLNRVSEWFENGGVGPSPVLPVSRVESRESQRMEISRFSKTSEPEISRFSKTSEPEPGDAYDGFFKKCIEPMLAIDRKDRPTAEQVTLLMRESFKGEDLGAVCGCKDVDGGHVGDVRRDGKDDRWIKVQRDSGNGNGNGNGKKMGQGIGGGIGGGMYEEGVRAQRESGVMGNITEETGDDD